MRRERGVTLIELTMILGVLATGIGLAAPVLGSLVPTLRLHGAAADIYAAIHLTRARARATGVMHALVIEPGGRALRVVEDPTGAARTVAGPMALVAGVVASGNTTIRFSPKGFAVPFGTITVVSGDQVRYLIVNLLGRVRLADTPPGP
ncbi:MAG: GspH/FimT family pseudopilin [Candidatus Rokuibacteriota bacterium]